MNATHTPAEQFFGRFVHPLEGRALIVGSRIYDAKPDRRRAFADALGVDMLPGDGVDRVLDLEEPLPDDIGTFSHVECLSVLEHSRRPWQLAANLERLLVKGGTLYVSAPFVWRFHGYPSDYFRFTAEGVRSLFHHIRWARLMYASNRLRDDHYVRAAEIEGHAHLPRTEVLGFGVRA